MDVLVVDDDNAFARVAAHALRKDGLDVVLAASADEALSLIRQSPPKLVVLNLMLLGINGLQALLVLKSDSATANIPVLVWTATVTEDITDVIHAERTHRFLASASKLLSSSLDVASTINRLVSFFPPEEQLQVRARIADNLRAVVSLRLLANKKGTARVPAVDSGEPPLFPYGYGLIYEDDGELQPLP